jgi:excisionase family DNA binding protein
MDVRILMTTRRPARNSVAKSERDWITSGQVARALDMTDAAIRRWAREGLIHAIKTPGGQYRFRREVIASVLEGKHSHKPEPRKAPRPTRRAGR